MSSSSSLCAVLDYRTIHHIAFGDTAAAPYHRLTALHDALGGRHAYDAPPQMHSEPPPRHWRGYVCGASNMLAWSHVDNASVLLNDSATASVAACELPAVTLAVRATVSDIILLDALEDRRDWCDEPTNFVQAGFRGLALCLTHNTSRRRGAIVTHTKGVTVGWLTISSTWQNSAVPLEAIDHLWEAHINSSVSLPASNETLRAAVLVSGQVRGLQLRLGSGSEWADFVARSRPGAVGNLAEDPERAGLHWGTPQMGVFENIQLNVISALRHVDVFMYTTWRGGMASEPAGPSDHSYCRLLDPVRRGAARDNQLFCRVEREPTLDRLSFLDAESWAHFSRQSSRAAVSPARFVPSHTSRLPSSRLALFCALCVTVQSSASLCGRPCRNCSSFSSSTACSELSRCAMPTSANADSAMAGWFGCAQIRSLACRSRRFSISTRLGTSVGPRLAW